MRANRKQTSENTKDKKKNRIKLVDHKICRHFPTPKKNEIIYKPGIGKCFVSLTSCILYTIQTISPVENKDTKKLDNAIHECFFELSCWGSGEET